MNKNRIRHKYNTLFKSISIAFLAMLLSTPFILNGIFSGDLDESWIGFWGSFSGGILGTLGVIFVAYIQSTEQRLLNAEQNEEQRRLTKEQNEEQISRLHEAENFQRQRLFIESEIDLIRNYHKDLTALKYELLTLKRKIMNLYRVIIYSYNSPISEKYFFEDDLNSLRKDRDYTYLHTLSSSVMHDKWIVDSLNNFSGIEKTPLFLSQQLNDVEGVVLRLNDMYEMLSKEGINLKVFHDNYGYLVTLVPHEEDRIRMTGIPMAMDLKLWLDNEIEYAKKILVGETNYLRSMTDRNG